jgi:hypothetical protein
MKTGRSMITGRSIKELPYHLILYEILPFYLFEITDETKSLDLFGKIRVKGRGTDWYKFDQIFNNVRIVSCNKMNRIYFCPDKLLYIEIGYSNSRKRFNLEGATFNNLLELNIRGEYCLSDFFTSVKPDYKTFPKVKLLWLSWGDQCVIDPIPIRIYPQKILISHLTSIEKKYFCNEKAKNFKSITISKPKLYNIYEWVQLDKLEDLVITDCVTDSLFRTQKFPKLKSLKLHNSKQINGDYWIGCKNLEEFVNWGEEYYNPKNLIKFKKLKYLYYRALSNFKGVLLPDSLEEVEINSDIYLENLCSLNKVKKLELRGKFPKDKWPLLINLENLKIWGSCDENNILYYVRILENDNNFPKLKKLYIDNLNISYINDSLCNQLEKLDLSMVGDSLDDIFVKRKFSNLKSLVLYKTDTILKNWNNMPKLEKIYMNIENENILCIFDSFRFENLRYLHLFVGVEFNNENDDYKPKKIYLPKLDDKNFKKLKEIWIDGPSLGVDILLDNYAFDALEDVFIQNTRDNGSNWKYIKNLKKVYGDCGSLIDTCQEWIREKVIFAGF